MDDNDHCKGATVPGTGATCLAKCATFTADQLTCRKDHCNLSDGPTSVHCKHAIGDPATGSTPGKCK
jgi:hypothetical protein